MTPQHSAQFPEPPVPGVVLAGGRSSRMGRVKALLPWPPVHGDRPLVTCVTEVLRAAGVAPLAVVTGVHHDEIAAVLDPRLTTVLFNPDHASGQLSSLQCGLAWAWTQTSGDWVLSTLVDVPGVRVDTVRALVDAARRVRGDGHALAVRPTCAGRHGHPVLWHRATAPRLAAADPDCGARQVMRALAAEAFVLDLLVDDEAVLRDVDTWDEYVSS
ncbi:MAG: nucleotidyltransferase family protein [Acidobacteria bacterium]|nr:nucleotidyltransferase family protein [Acidobacteriota bacterium]